MKQNVWRRILLMFLIPAVYVGAAGGCIEKERENKTEEARLSVVTTLFPYYDFVRAVAGDSVDLKLILPPGQESHSFEPTAADLIAMEEADVLIYNGGESEQWVERVLESADSSGRLCMAGMDIVSLYEEETAANMKQTFLGGGHSHDHEEEDAHAQEDGDAHVHNREPGEMPGTAHEDEGESMGEALSYEIEYDEHIWTSPVNAIRLTEAVRDTLTEANPEQAELFASNAEAYIGQLEEIDRNLRQTAQNGSRDILVFADRFPFLYFVKEYGLRYDAAFSGCSSDTEPSAATIAGLIDLIREEAIPAVYHVEQGSRKTAEIIRESTGVEVMELHSCHNVTKEQLDAGVTYVDLMKQNLENLKKGLQ